MFICFAFIVLIGQTHSVYSFFLLYSPHHVCLSYTVCKSVILVSQINAFTALVCLDKGVFLFNAPMNSLEHLQILISGVVQ